MRGWPIEVRGWRLGWSGPVDKSEGLGLGWPIEVRGSGPGSKLRACSHNVWPCLFCTLKGNSTGPEPTERFSGGLIWPKTAIFKLVRSFRASGTSNSDKTPGLMTSSDKTAQIHSKNTSKKHTRKANTQGHQSTQMHANIYPPAPVSAAK